MGFLLCNGICVRIWSEHKNSGGFAPEKLHKKDEKEGIGRELQYNDMVIYVI